MSVFPSVAHLRIRTDPGAKGRRIVSRGGAERGAGDSWTAPTVLGAACVQFVVLAAIAMAAGSGSRRRPSDARGGPRRAGRPAGLRARPSTPRSPATEGDAGSSVAGLRDTIRQELARLLEATRPTADANRPHADPGRANAESGRHAADDEPLAPAPATGGAVPDPGSAAPVAAAELAAATAELARVQAEVERLRISAAGAQRDVDSARQEADVLRHDAEAVRNEADAVRQEADAIRREAEVIRRAAHNDADAERRTAQSEGAELLQQARGRIAAERTEAKGEADERRRELDRQRGDLDRQRGDLDSQARALREERDAAALAAADLAARVAELDVRAEDLVSRAGELDRRGSELDRVAADHDTERARISGLSVADARAELLASVQTQATRDAAILARDIEDTARHDATERARRIVAEAVQRVASAQTAETVVSVMPLPGDDMKGRIIGREGRNIRAFEAVTGVNIIIDDTPEAVLLSCFDPVRREVGRLTLDKLVLDGRIHPHRIEEAYEQSKVEVDELCRRAATDALAEVGVGDLDEHLIPTLGRLKYRTSYGQNVLGHLVETAHVAGIMAAELGLEPTLIKRCAFLHDIGKALTHEVEGSHAIVGAELLRKYGESDAVAHAVEAHHNEVQPTTIEAVLTQASDACSAARPGARREALEAYVNRLKRVEEIASSRPGVERVFAMQAGREVRVMVTPADVDDLAAQVIAREVAKQIEDELTYPGQIRVTVVRETRASETAH